MEWTFVFLIIGGVIVLGALLWAWGWSQKQQEKKRRLETKRIADLEAKIRVKKAEYDLFEKNLKEASGHEKRELERKLLEIYYQWSLMQSELFWLRRSEIAKEPENSLLPDLPEIKWK